jgi:hypothetical protein
LPLPVAPEPLVADQKKRGVQTFSTHLLRLLQLDAKRASALHSYDASLRSSSTTPSSSFTLARR